MPSIIEPPSERRRGYKPGDEINFGLILIGRAIDYLPYFIYTFDELGRIGIEEDLFQKQAGDYKDVIARSPDKHRDDEAISLLFITPTRILYNGHLTLDLEFHILIRNLLRRLSLLYYFHCDDDPSEWDFKGIIERAKEVTVKNRNLRWYDWERYSGRQDTRMKMGGFVGEITFEGNIEPFMPLIKAGEVLHVGKGTGFGLGKYRIVKDIRE